MSDSFFLPNASIQETMVSKRLESVKGRLIAGKTEVSSKDNARMKDVCKELESLFISELFKQMRATIPKSGMVSGGNAEEIYQSMLDSNISKELSQGRGVGLASILMKQLQGGFMDGGGGLKNK
jgi:peptidoglycan hydrolase FlgJ